jgi:hypothetical protein
MPQVFGSEQIDLISEASLWVDSASLQGDPRTTDLFGQFLNQEGFGEREKGLSPEETSLANGRLIYTRSLGNKTIRDQPPRRDSSGQLLNGNGYHEFVVHLNPRVAEGSKETSVGGPKRYELSYHHVDRDGGLLAVPIWSGNTPHGLNNAHEAIKARMLKMR